LLRAHRLHAGLTQDELARQSGLSVAAISKLERETRRRPQAPTVFKLADSLDMDERTYAAFVVVGLQ